MIASYPVWLAVLPAIGWFGLRFVRDRRLGDLLGMTLALGIGMMIRSDLLAFGSPLWPSGAWLRGFPYGFFYG